MVTAPPVRMPAAVAARGLLPTIDHHPADPRP